MYDAKQEKLAMEYFNNNPTPDQSLCPRLIITYQGNNKKLGQYTNFYVPSTGQKFINTAPFEFNNYSNQKGGRNINYSPTCLAVSIYAKYIPELEAVEIGKIYLKNGRPDRKLNQDIRKWEWVSKTKETSDKSSPKYDINYFYHCEWYDSFIDTPRIMLFRGNMTAYGPNGVLWQKDDGKYYNHLASRYFNSFRRYMFTDCSSQQLRLFFNKSTDWVTSGRLHNYNCSDYLKRGYKTWLPRKTSEKAKENYKNTEQAMKETLTDIEVIKNKYKQLYKMYSHYRYPSKEASFYVAEVDSKDNLILRGFKRIGSSPTYTGTIKDTILEGEITDIREISRIVINKKKDIVFCQICGDTFRERKNATVLMDWDNCSIRNPQVVIDYFPDTKLFFDNAKELVGYDVLSYNQGQSLVDYIRQPIISELLKRKLHNLAKLFCSLSYTQKEIELMFGAKISNSSKKCANLEKLVGLNSYQLKLFNEIISDIKNRYAISDLKFLLESKDVSSLDDMDSKMYIKAIEQRVLANMQWIQDYTPINYRYSVYDKDRTPLDKEYKDLILKMLKAQYLNPSLKIADKMLVPFARYRSLSDSKKARLNPCTYLKEDFSNVAEFVKEIDKLMRASWI